MLDFSAGDLAQLCELISGGVSDVLFRADDEGFIVQASQGVALLSDALPAFLIPPRLQDLVGSDHLPAVEAELALAAAGNADRGWIEFPLASGPLQGRWYALRLVPARERRSGRHVLGMLRDVHERRMLEDRVFTTRMTDPLTGLTNRLAFDAMLDHVVSGDYSGCLALLTVDHFRAINHRFGCSFGDDVLVGFSQVLRTVMRTGDTISRVGACRFAVLLVETDEAQAWGLCSQVQALFADELLPQPERLPLSASAGIARFGHSAQDTLRRAELALAPGRNSGQIRRERPVRPLATMLPTRVPETVPRHAG